MCADDPTTPRTQPSALGLAGAVAVLAAAVVVIILDALGFDL